MVFSSPIFLFLFFPITFGVYFVIPSKFRNIWLFLCSFVFYAWSGLGYGLLMLGSLFANYIFGFLCAKPKHNRRWLAAAVLFNVALLGFFKYFNFFTDSLQTVIWTFSPAFVIDAPRIPLPIGISFYTFQIMSYVIDVYRGQVKLQRSFVTLGLYLMLFPQLVAGPIVRYADVEQECSHREHSLDNVCVGLRRFIVGLAKKMLLANSMGGLADAAFNNPQNLNTPLAWLGILAYTFQIFFDFSAYSDMGIGMGRMLGFHFLENFNYPYISTSMQEFWRRWHMSLSTWFRDYLYIPLGGSRKGTVRTYINLCIVFFVTGLWHGAAWNFVIWGLYNGFFLIIERMGFGKVLKKLPRWIAHVYTILCFMVGWVLFRANSIGAALEYLRTMFSLNFAHMEWLYFRLDNQVLIVLGLSLLFSMPVAPALRAWFSHRAPNTPLRGGVQAVGADIAYTLLFLVCVLFVSGSNFNPFIYFRF